MKTLAKILLVILTLTLALSVCSCSTVKSAARDISRVPEYTSKLIEITKMKNSEEAMAKAEELIHPTSDLTVETIIEKAKADKDLEGVDIEKLISQGYSIGNFSEPKLKFNDPELGGNVYEVSVDVVVGGQTFTVTLDLLSDDVGMGLYDFDISRPAQ